MLGRLGKAVLRDAWTRYTRSVTTPLDQPPWAVLRHFAPHTNGLSWDRAGGGFSGAVVWCGAADGTPQVALKAWPVGVTMERVRQVHGWVARAARRPFVPVVYPGAGARTTFAHERRVWECARWQPGVPLATPSVAEVEAACMAVAELHSTWAPVASRGPCPGVLNRLRILAEAEPLLRAGPDALAPVAPLIDPVLRRAAAAAARVAPGITAELQAWAGRVRTLHPCVRDLRGEHILFQGNLVTGIVDYGAMAVDHPAVDLARLFLDYAPTNEPLRTVGCEAYRRVWHSLDAPEEFLGLLIRSGAVCSALGWLVRLVVRREPISAVASAAERLTLLIMRVENM